MKICKRQSTAVKHASSLPVLQITIGGQSIFISGISDIETLKAGEVTLLTSDGAVAGNVSIKGLDRLGYADEATPRAQTDASAFTASCTGDLWQERFDKLRAAFNGAEEGNAEPTAEPTSDADSYPLRVEFEGTWDFEFSVGALRMESAKKEARLFAQRNPGCLSFTVWHGENALHRENL